MSGRSMILLRQVPGDSVVHRLWAGSKLVAVVALGLCLSWAPSWPAIAAVAGLLAVAARLARIPRGAVPRPPGAFWAVMALGAVLAAFSGGRPEVAVGGIHVGLGHVELYVRFVCLSVVLFLASALVGWTTPLGEVAPALARLGGPLRRVRLPVDEWAVTVALCVRSLPLLVEEVRILMAARRLRPAPPGRRGVTGVVDEVVDVLTAALAASIRRAGEMGEAITARGGTGRLTASATGPGRPDIVALALVAAVCAAVVGSGYLP